MKIAANHSHLRAMNQRTVLDAIYKKGPISRAQLARLLHLSKPAMADNVTRLLGLGIINEIGEPDSLGGVGRKPIMISVNPNYRYIIIIDFNYKTSIFNLFNLRGEAINQFSVRQVPHQNFESWLEMSLNAVRTLLLSQDIGPGDLAAIGISSPGIISSDQSEIINSPMFGDFNPQVLYRTLRSELKCPVYIKNSANASALGEWAEGAGQGTSSMLYISCGQGLGAGIIIDGKLHEGSRVAAGEVYRYVTPETVELTSTLEERICIAGLLSRFGGTFDEFVSLFERGDDFCLKLMDEIGLQLGCLICNLVMALDCDLVVIGGDYLAFKERLIPYIQALVNRKCVISVPVAASSMQERASSIGMATICREMYFDWLCSAHGSEPRGT